MKARKSITDTLFGSRIRERRRDKTLTQADLLKRVHEALASETALSHSGLSRIENGKAPSPEVRRALLAVLDLDDPAPLPSDPGAMWLEAVEAALDDAVLEGPWPGHQKESFWRTGVIHTAQDAFLIHGYMPSEDKGEYKPPRDHWYLLKVPPLVKGKPDSAAFHRAFYLHQSLPQIVGLARKPLLVELDADHFSARYRDAMGLSFRIPLLMYPSAVHDLRASPPRSLTQVELMTRGVITLGDLQNWCSIASSMIALTIGLFQAGWTIDRPAPEAFIAHQVEDMIHTVTLIDLRGLKSLNDTRINPVTRSIQELGRLLGAALTGPTQDLDFDLKRGRRLSDWKKDTDHLEHLRLEFASLHSLCLDLIGSTPSKGRSPAQEIEGLNVHLDLINGIDAKARAKSRDWPNLASSSHLGTFETLLRSLESKVSLQSETNWADHYAYPRNPKSPASDQPPPDKVIRDFRALKANPGLQKTLDDLKIKGTLGRCEDFEKALDNLTLFLKEGFVNFATEQHFLLLRDHRPTPGNEATWEFYNLVIRALRRVVGVLLLRNFDATKAKALLDDYDDENAKENLSTPRGALKWWINMLRIRCDKLDESHSIEKLTERWRSLEIPDKENPSMSRAFDWHLAGRLHLKLAAEGPTEHLHEETEELSLSRRRATSTPESLFSALLLARGYFNNDPNQGLRWLSAGVAESAARGFPVEYGIMLMHGTLFTLDLIEAGDKAFSGSDGAPDSKEVLAYKPTLLRIAEGQALRAAHIFHRVEHPRLAARALRYAARCALELNTTESLQQTLRWRRLGWSNTTILAKKNKENAETSLARDERMEAQDKALEELRKVLADAPHRIDDAGSAASARFYQRYGPGYVEFLGSGHLSWDSFTDEDHKLGRYVGGLVKEHVFAQGHDARRIIDLGCGPGTDVFLLADIFKQAEIYGIDVSTWAIKTALQHRQKNANAARCHFDHVTINGLAAGTWRGPEGGADLVIVRDTLWHVSFHDRLLEALTNYLAPGALVLINDIVQHRTCSPVMWEEILDALNVISVSTLPDLKRSLHKAGFEEVTSPTPKNVVDQTEALYLGIKEQYRSFKEDDHKKHLREKERMALRVTFITNQLLRAFHPVHGPLKRVSIVARYKGKSSR